jgi:hypothetical protein
MSRYRRTRKARTDTSGGEFLDSSAQEGAFRISGRLLERIAIGLDHLAWSTRVAADVEVPEP